MGGMSRSVQQFLFALFAIGLIASMSTSPRQAHFFCGRRSCSRRALGLSYLWMWMVTVQQPMSWYLKVAG